MTFHYLLTGTMRVLVATIAYGMGIHVENLKRIIHLGPPKDIDDCQQETGRAGMGIFNMFLGIFKSDV